MTLKRKNFGARTSFAYAPLLTLRDVGIPLFTFACFALAVALFVWPNLRETVDLVSFVIVSTLAELVVNCPHMFLDGGDGSRVLPYWPLCRFLAPITRFNDVVLGVALAFISFSLVFTDLIAVGSLALALLLSFDTWRLFYYNYWLVLCVAASLTTTNAPDVLKLTIRIWLSSLYFYSGYVFVLFFFLFFFLLK